MFGLPQKTTCLEETPVAIDFFEPLSSTCTERLQPPGQLHFWRGIRLRLALEPGTWVLFSETKPLFGEWDRHSLQETDCHSLWLGYRDPLEKGFYRATLFSKRVRCTPRVNPVCPKWRSFLKRNQQLGPLGHSVHLWGALHTNHGTSQKHLGRAACLPPATLRDPWASA